MRQVNLKYGKAVNMENMAISEKELKLLMNFIKDDLTEAKESDDNEVKNNKQIIQEWMVAENNRMREENVLRTAREDGLKEGIEQGIQEEKIQSIRKMLQRGDTYEDISEITGKTIEEIKEIESSM